VTQPQKTRCSCGPIRSAGWQAGFARFRSQIGVALLAALLGAGPLHPQATPTVEYQVKAAFLYNFAKFIEWPPDSFASEKSPMSFCIFGHDPFGTSFDEALRGKKVNNREFLPRRVKEYAELRTCHLVFVSWQEDKHLPEILSSVKGASVLVVGESADFAGRGGTVQFLLEENKLRFAVNLEAAKRARLQISSKLLALATIVGDGAHQEVN